MLHKFANILFLSLAILNFAIAPSPALAQDEAATKSPTFTTEELDQMLAPVALYPDEVLANVLMAATYPLDVVQAARWRSEAANKALKGDMLSKALEAKNWDPSVKALTLFPEVLQNMSKQLEWTQNLGDAFLGQEEDVFARVQYLRQKADAAGSLKTNKQQTVKKQSNPETRTEYIIIEPADPQYVYVPIYQPAVVYGSWPYPSYPPYYWNWSPGATFVNGLFWGAGVAVANSIWGWNDFNWNSGRIDIDVNRYNNININRTAIKNNHWEHNSLHRGAVPYRDKATREKYSRDNQLRDRSKDFSGFDKSKSEGVRSRDPDNIKNVRDRSDSKFSGEARDKAGQKLSDREPKPNYKPDGAPRKDIKSKDIKNKATRDLKGGGPKPEALDVKPKAQVQKHVDRGAVSRKAAAGHSAANRTGGHGHARGGGMRN